MTVSVLDPHCALIVVDLQQGIASVPTVHPMAEVIARSAELAAAFRRRGLPVVLVNAIGGAPGRSEAGSSRPAGFVPPPGWADIVSDLDPQESDLRVSKKTWGAFHQTELDELLRARGVTQVVVTGVATTAGVESTARAAHEHGYHVVLATDAMSDRNAEAHANSVTRIFPKLGETGSTAEILALLEAR